MSIKLAAWNVQEGLDKYDRQPQITDAVIAQDADVIVLSDAFSLNNPLHSSDEDTLFKANATFTLSGYRISIAEYGAADNWPHDRHIMMLNRLGPAARVAQLATRAALLGVATDPSTGIAVNVLGEHGDDRTAALRNDMARVAVRELEAAEAAVILGDLNMMWRSSAVAQTLASPVYGKLAQLIQQKRAHSVATRLHEMADQAALHILKVAGFADANKADLPTFPSRKPLVSIDHILFRGPHIKVEDFAVAGHNPASDHRLISATLIS